MTILYIFLNLINLSFDFNIHFLMKPLVFLKHLKVFFNYNILNEKIIVEKMIATKAEKCFFFYLI